METEKKKKWREIHERETALLIAKHLEKRRLDNEKFWQEFDKKKEVNNG